MVDVLSQDHSWLATNLFYPVGASEFRTVTTGGLTMSGAFLAAGRAYEVFAEGATVYMRTDATTPVISDGTGSLGIPIGDGQTKLIVWGASNSAIRLKTRSGTGYVTVTQVASGAY